MIHREKGKDDTVSQTKARSFLEDMYTVLDSVCAFLLVLCPFLQHFQGLVVDARATVLILLAPYLLVRMWMKNQVKWLLIAPIVLFSVWKILDDGTSINEIGREGIVCLFLLAAASGVIDFNKFIRAWIAVATIGSVLILVQYVYHHVFDTHLQLIPTAMFLPNSDQWMGLAETGKISILGNPLKMYRPSSIFMEPSHMAMYCTPALLMLLLSPKFNWRRCLLAVLITVGVIASTSGLGIVLCMGLWFLYLALYCGDGGSGKPIGFIKGFTLKERRFAGIPIKGKRYGSFTFHGLTVRPINIILVGSLVLGAVLMYLFVEVFRDSINRILFSEDGYNAIAGRTVSGARAVSDLRGSEWLLGKAVPGSEASWYMSAFYETIYKYGLIGAAISYVFYVVSLFKLKRQYCWLALLLLGLSFLSVHTHGSAFMLIYCILLLAGYQEAGVDDPKGLSLRIHPLGWFSKKKEAINE